MYFCFLAQKFTKRDSVFETIRFIHQKSAEEKEKRHSECDKNFIDAPGRRTFPERMNEDMIEYDEKHRKASYRIYITDSLCIHKK